METASAKDLKAELKQQSPEALVALCLRLSRFKKENKELLSYLLFWADDETEYVQTIKEIIDEQFEQINRQNWYYIKKGVRKILTTVRKYSRYSNQKATEVELRLHFARRLQSFQPSIRRNRVLRNLFERQLTTIQTAIGKLHEDLQQDYEQELQALGL